MYVKSAIGTLLLMMASATHAIDYQKMLIGKRLIMKGANCAGLAFDANPKYASMIGEIDCMHGYDDGLALRVKWIKSDTFVLIEREQQKEGFPPRNYIYTVQKINGNKVILKEYWTGWNELKDDLQEYTVK